jgi:hypothetical protein
MQRAERCEHTASLCSQQQRCMCVECDSCLRQLCCAGDGSNSVVRKQLGIKLEGPGSLQSLINIHFSSHELAQALRQDPAMLYFVYSPVAVLVLVAHDLSGGLPLAYLCLQLVLSATHAE